MSREPISVRVTVRDELTPFLRELWWKFWWLAWGTHGYMRRRALVVLDR